MLCHGTVCVVGKIRDLILQLSKSSIYSTKPTSIGVAHSNECTTVERLKMLADERLYKSKKNGRAQISWQ
ncbi:hypothetical protein CDN92_06495 [Escherichia coli]|nr:hypothetical protein CDN90_06240 [Escherichia coli]PAS87797.1 hypothetical protein CDN92_06495 [Escherichia coli]